MSRVLNINNYFVIELQVVVHARVVTGSASLTWVVIPVSLKWRCVVESFGYYILITTVLNQKLLQEQKLNVWISMQAIIIILTKH